MKKEKTRKEVLRNFRGQNESLLDKQIAISKLLFANRKRRENMIKKTTLFCLCAVLAVSSWASNESQSDLQSILADLTSTQDGITVMTRNIYIGANVDTILAATDPAQVPLLAAEAYQVMLSTNFPERAQAQELLAAVATQEYPMIIVGDFNSPAKGGDTYQFIRSQGYVDSWRHNLLREFLMYNKLGNTDSHDDDLRNEKVHLTKRIDLIFVQSQVSVGGYQDIGPVVAFVVGDELKDRTPSGLWPSDHCGVVAKLWIPEN